MPGTAERSTCIAWTGALDRDGYGKVSRPRHGTYMAHRAAYIGARGPIAPGLQLDHLCRNRACVNPEHLEPVTARENTRRANAARTLCMNGLHDITAEGALYPGTRRCVACRRAKEARKEARRRMGSSKGGDAI